MLSDPHEAHSLLGEVADVGSFAVAQLLVLVGGCALQLIWFMRDLARRLNVGQLGEMVKKLVDVGNTERAIKFCKATPAPAAALLRVGLEALLEKHDPREAMRQMLPNHLKIVRAGLRGTMVLGALAFAEGVSLLVRGMNKGVGEAFTTLMLFLLGTLAGLAIWNAIRAGQVRRDLEYVTELLG